ncbi:MAG: hypothetical protein AAGI71_05205 [Bacteroidota bacterium]
MKAALSLALAVLMGLAGCTFLDLGQAFGPDDAGTDVFFSTAASKYAATDSLTIRLENRRGQTVEYNLFDACLSLQRWEADQWVTLDVTEWLPPDRGCDLIAFVLEPGATVTRSFTVREALARGFYRLGTEVGVGPGPFELIWTNTFVIRGDQ